MNYDEEMEDPWPGLTDKLIRNLTREELDTFADSLKNKLPAGWGKNKHHKKLPKMDVIRHFIDTLSEDYGESGFMKLMIDVTKTKKLRFRTGDGNDILLHDYLKQCEKKRKMYKKHCREMGILKNCDFVGRKEEMETVTRLLLDEANDQKAGIWISGMGGTGKTTLANQVCGKQNQYRKLYVDLKTTSNIEDFYNRLTGPLDIPPLQQDQKICWETIYEELRTKKSAVVLYLDSFETLLSPNNPDKRVWEILRQILSIQNSKVKLLITSVHRPDDCIPGQHSPDDSMPGPDPLENMKHLPLQLFTLEECHQLIRRVAPKIMRDPKQKSNIETVVSKLCAFNTLAVQAVFSYLKKYSNCITLKKFLADHKQQLESAENNDQQTSQVITTLGRVFDGLNQATRAALIKLSLCNGVQFDFTLAQCLLGENRTTTLYSLVKARLLQMEVKDKTSTAGSKIGDEDTRFFLHSLLQNLLERKRAAGDFEKDVEAAKSNIRAYIMNRLLELGKMETYDPKGKAGVIGSELQPLVLKYSSMPSINIEHYESYHKAFLFQASLQHFLNRKNLEQFYAEQLELASGPQQILKRVYLKLSQIDVLLKNGSSLESAEVKLYEVEEELRSFTIDPPPQALKLSWAHFNLVHGKYLGLCRKFQEGIDLIQEALKVYNEVEACSTQAARALHAIASILDMKPLDPYTASESMKYNKRAFDKLGASTVHFDQIVYTMDIGIKAHVLGGLKQESFENAKKRKKELSQKEVDEYNKDIKKRFDEASSSYEMSIGLCEKLKMKRSLEYIKLLRQNALLLAEYDDIKKIEKAVKMAEESYLLLQEYDKEDMMHMAKCCFAIAHVHKRLGVKIFEAIRQAKEDYTEEQRYAPLWETYHKFKRGFEYMKKGNIFADMQDYYGWRSSLQETMRWLGLSEEEKNKLDQEIEWYIKNNIRKRKSSAQLQSALPDMRTRKESLQGMKRRSIDQSQEDVKPSKRRGSVVMDDTSTGNKKSSLALAKTRRSNFKKEHSVSDDIPMDGLNLNAELMETCPEKKPTGLANRIKDNLINWKKIAGDIFSLKTDVRQVEKDPEELSESNSNISGLSDKDSALTGYSKAPSVISKSGSSTDMDQHDTLVRQSPLQSAARNYTYPQASVSHVMMPSGMPEIEVTGVGEAEEDSLDKDGRLPFHYYASTDSPCSKVKQWLNIEKQKRPSSPGGSSDDSFHSTYMDVQEEGMPNSSKFKQF
ncbi:uncharacterized protein LOC135488481 [Lineus longissimus]|uniref:uncharacterized protein LOC135488481 n=1 Tax=Lineus longissimus TaxID=88925 RepID=UPI00315C9D07